MRISLNWLKDYVELGDDISAGALMHDLTMSTVEVEFHDNLSASLRSVVVGEIQDIRRVSGKQSLSYATCDIGTGSPIGICTSNPGVRKSMLVAVALPSATIRSAGHKDAVEVSVREVAGELSEGRICRQKHLPLSNLFPMFRANDVLDLSFLGVPPGTALSTAIGWDDSIFEIDNKSLTNRPDLWGHHGIARELAAIYDLELKPRRAYLHDLPFEELLGDIDAKNCFRFKALRVENLSTIETPFWMKSRLARIGQNPVSFLVDLSNYVMFDTGQPSHVYDAAKIHLPLGVRIARPGESVALLDNDTYRLSEENLTIFDASGPVAAAGVMGGDSSRVTEATSEVVIEFATFDSARVRMSAQRLGLRTDASTRFDKGLDTQRSDDAMNLFLSLLGEIAPSARVAGFQDVCPVPTRKASIEVTVDFLTRHIGIDLSVEQITAFMHRLCFDVTAAGQKLSVTVPTWRSTGDVSLPHDLVEEVARLYGYDRFPVVAPRIDLETRKTSRAKSLQRNIKETLSRLGNMHEIVRYPWVDEIYLKAAGFAVEDLLQLAAPPSPDQRCLQPSLIPGLLESVHINRRFFSAFRIFELARVFLKRDAEQTGTSTTSESLPYQPHRLAAAFVGDNPATLLRQAKGVLEALVRATHLPALEFVVSDVAATWAEPAAQLQVRIGDAPVGAIGLVNNQGREVSGVRKGAFVAFEIDVETLAPTESGVNHYEPIPAFPGIEIDLSLILPVDTPWEAIERRVVNANPLIRKADYVDDYRGKEIPAHRKSLTIRLYLRANDRTLKIEESRMIVKEILDDLRERFSAEVRS